MSNLKKAIAVVLASTPMNHPVRVLRDLGSFGLFLTFWFYAYKEFSSQKKRGSGLLGVGAHDLKQATSICSCHGVFMDQFIFRTVLAPILNIY